MRGPGRRSGERRNQLRQITTGRTTLEYLEHRKGILYVKDAHNLYVETLAELGAVGLALLAVALAVPLAAAIVARHRLYAPFIFAAYVAYLVHAAADWGLETRLRTGD